MLLHTAKITQELLPANCPEMFRYTECPPSSPNLNPLDYHVWDEQLIHKTRENCFNPLGFCNKELKKKTSNQPMTNGNDGFDCNPRKRGFNSTSLPRKK